MGDRIENTNIKVFMYHRILNDASENEKDCHAVSAENFRRQLEILDMFNFTPITFEDYQLCLEDKLTLPKKPVILTFDDGHLDTYEVALPILREFEMRAVIYVVGNRNLEYAYWDQKDGTEILPLMTDEQILQVRAEGFEIGAHTMNHPVLTNLSTEDQIKEIAGSKQVLEDLLNEQILSFAYPYGALDQRTHEITKQAGFKFACGVYTGPAKFGDDIYNIRRIAVGYKTGMFAYLTKLLMPYEYLGWLNYKLRHKTPDADKKVGEITIPEIDYEPMFDNFESN